MTQSNPFSKYKDIPAQLRRYYQRLLKENPQHKLIMAIREQGENITWGAINDLFRLSSQAAKLTPDELYKCIGFKPNDLDENNFQALLGILRTINLLIKMGFQKLQPLRPKKARKEVDLLGRFSDKLFAIEIIRSSEKKYCYTDHEGPSSNPTTYIANRYGEKCLQLDSSIGKHGCDAGMLCVVMDSQPFKALVSPGELFEVAEQSFLAMGSPDKTYLLIFTGMRNPNGEDEYVVYPPLEYKK